MRTKVKKINKAYMKTQKKAKIKPKNKQKRAPEGSLKQIVVKAKKTPLWSKFDFVEEKTDKFWDKKAFKQCLWQYFIKINKGKLTSEVEKDKVWIEFNSIGTYAERKFEEKKNEEKKEKEELSKPGKIDYIKKLYDGLEKRGLKTFIQKNNYTLKYAKLNLTNITQVEAQQAIGLILRAEAEKK